MVSVRDILVIAVLLLVIGIAITAVVYTSHIIIDQFRTVDVFINNTEVSNVLDAGDTAIDSSDYIYFVSFLAFFIAICVTGYFAATHPVFSVIYFIIVVIFVFVSVILQFVWDNLSTSPMFVSTLPNLPLTNFILTHLAYFVAVFGLVGILLMFAKKSNEGAYGY